MIVTRAQDQAEASAHSCRSTTANRAGAAVQSMPLDQAPQLAKPVPPTTMTSSCLPEQIKATTPRPTGHLVTSRAEQGPGASLVAVGVVEGHVVQPSVRTTHLLVRQPIPSRQRIPSSPVPSCPPQIAAYSCPPILPMARSCPAILPMARHRLPPTHPSFNQSILLHIALARRPSTRPTRAHHTHPPIHPLTHLLDLSHAIQPSAYTSARSLPCHPSISTSPPIHPPIHSMSQHTITPTHRFRHPTTAT